MVSAARRMRSLKSKSAPRSCSFSFAVNPPTPPFPSIPLSLWYSHDAERSKYVFAISLHDTQRSMSCMRCFTALSLSFFSIAMMLMWRPLRTALFFTFERLSHQTTLVRTIAIVGGRLGNFSCTFWWPQSAHLLLLLVLFSLFVYFLRHYKGTTKNRTMQVFSHFFYAKIKKMRSRFSRRAAAVVNYTVNKSSWKII